MAATLFAYLIIGFIEPVCDLYRSKSKMAGTLYGTFIFDIRVREFRKELQTLEIILTLLIS